MICINQINAGKMTSFHATDWLVAFYPGKLSVINSHMRTISQKYESTCFFHTETWTFLW